MTVTRFENDRSGGYASTLRKIQAALEAAGVVFIDGDDTIGPGVHLRDPQKK